MKKILLVPIVIIIASFAIFKSQPYPSGSVWNQFNRIKVDSVSSKDLFLIGHNNNPTVVSYGQIDSMFSTNGSSWSINGNTGATQSNLSGTTDGSPYLCGEKLDSTYAYFYNHQITLSSRVFSCSSTLQYTIFSSKSLDSSFSVTHKLIYKDGNQAAGYILYSDANGVSHWESFQSYITSIYSGLGKYASDAAAGTAGLTTGQVYVNSVTYALTFKQ